MSSIFASLAARAQPPAPAAVPISSGRLAELGSGRVVKGTAWAFPYMVPLKQTKTVAQREGADSRAHFGRLDLETVWSNPGNSRFW